MNKVSADPRSQSHSMPPAPGYLRGSSGEPLTSISVGDTPAYPVSRVVEWADQLLESLGHLHNSTPATVHKSIRPSNLKITEDGAITLVSDDTATGSADDADEFAYSPLEQLWEKLDPASQKVIINSFDDEAEADLMAPLDPRSDLYSLAATLYHVMTGRKPSDALERSIEFLDGNADPLPRPDKLDSAIPPGVAEVLMTALNVKRGDRYESASAMREALKTAAPLTAAATPAADENPLLKKQQEIAAEQQRAADLEQRLREAEEQRILAEQRAAEAERLLRANDQAAAPIEAAVPASISDSPIEIEPLQAGSSSADFDSILILEADGGDPTARYAEPPPVSSPTPEPVKAAYDDDDNEPSFEQPRGSKTMFVVAGVAGVILVAAAIGFFALFSGKKAPAAVEAQPAPVVEQPAPEIAQPEPLQAAVENEEQAPANNTSAETAADVDAPRTAAASARPAARTQDRAATAAKPAAAKPTPEKKKVTVDDLISDH